jgi:dihydroorotase
MILLFKDAHVIDPASNMDSRMDVLVEGAKIVEVKSTIPESKVKVSKPANEIHDPLLSQDEVIHCKGKLLVPGFVDMHCHLREPGFEYKETIESGSRAGAAGGYTSLVCMANTLPVNDCQAVTEYILRQARECASTHIFPVGAVTKGLKGESLAEMGELKNAGVVALSDDGKPVMDACLFRRALEYAGGLGLSIISHCEDLHLTGRGVMNESLMATTLGLRGIPNAAEEVMVLRDIALAELTGSSLHVAHVSTAGSVRAIREAKSRGIKVTAETAPHYFSLTDEAVHKFDPNTKMNPPLRGMKDVKAIIEGLKDGTLDAIATDHAPQSAVEKDVEFEYAANGIIGLETALPLTLKLVQEGHLPLMKAIEKLTLQPARILGLAKGQLRVGAEADLALIDLDREHIVEVNQFKSKSRNSPFQGWKLKGMAVMTIVSGRIVYRVPGLS